MPKKKQLENNKFALVGFILGILSIFFAWIGLIPILGLTFSIIGLAKFDPHKEKNKWQAVIGLILNIIYFIGYLNMYGHINLT